MKRDEFMIRLDIAGEKISTIIKRDERTERVVREAAKRFDRIFVAFQQSSGEFYEDRQLLVMTALQMTTRLIELEEKNDLTPLTQKIQQLTMKLDNYLMNS